MRVEIVNGKLEVVSCPDEMEFSAFHTFLGGDIEEVVVPSSVEGMRVRGYCNAHAQIEGLPITCRIEETGVIVYGPFIIAGLDEEGGIREMSLTEALRYELFAPRPDVLPLLRRSQVPADTKA